MSEQLSEQRLQLLKQFAQAWNQHDIDALMSMMSPACSFASSAGDQIQGQLAEGSAAVRVAYEKIWHTFHDAQWLDDEHFVFGDKGLSQWRFVGTLANGDKVETNGCDVFEFDGNKIKHKDSYRKNRPPIKA